MFTQLISDLKNNKSTPHEALRFGTISPFTITIIAIFFWWRGNHIFAFFGLIALLIATIRILIPEWLLPIHRILFALITLVSWILMRIVLLLVFYFILTPIALFMRTVLKKQFLDLSFKSKRASYWRKRNTDGETALQFEKQY